MSDKPFVQARGPYLIRKRDTSDPLGFTHYVVRRIARGKQWERQCAIDEDEDGIAERMRDRLFEKAIRRLNRAIFDEAMAEYPAWNFPYLEPKQEEMTDVLRWLSQFKLPCRVFPGDVYGHDCELRDMERNLIVRLGTDYDTANLVASLLNALPVLLLARE